MSRRRRKIAIASAAVLLAASGLTVGLVVGVTQTGPGQEFVRRTLLDVVAPRIDGRLYVGRISGGFLGGVTVDSLEIRGADDSLFIAAGRIRVVYDVRDLIDRRVLLRHVEAERPVVRVVQAEDGSWNFKRIFRMGGPKGPKRGRGFGDFVVADSVVVRGGSLVLTLPWHPADSLRGARRDSAVAFALARRDAEIRSRRPGEWTRTWRWTNGEAALSHMRLADPDTAGRRFVIARLGLDESDPPFRWRNVRGDVRWLGDSIWMRADHWDLAGSTGTGRGKVVWGSDLPVRYDVRVQGDSVSLADVAWVYPTLPRTGSGRMALHIRNDPRNLRVIDYALSEMDVRTTKSRLRGAMTYAVGGPVLVVKDVALRADPVDWDLLRTLSGGPFPYDWQGRITGTVRARGGPLDRWQLDEARFAFADANVPGAVSRAVARGGLDILFPAFTKFRGLAVDVERLDLRTLTFLNPDFPQIGGTVAGRATLDSSWLDVRVRGADLTHVDGPGAPSRATGSGRVTWGERFMTYDLALDLQPLSLTTLARSYPMLPLRGLLAGPLRATGTADALRVATTLTGEAGTLSFDGEVDTYEPAYAARGTGQVSALDLRTLLGGVGAPTTRLAGRFEVDARGSAPADLAGSLALALDRSTIAGARVYDGVARLRFDAGRLLVDTLGVESTAGELAASGALGLGPGGAADTLRVVARVDSLGGLRPWLAAAVDGGVAPDSLAGSLRLVATLAGTVDTTAASGGLAVEARLSGDGLAYAATRAATAELTATLTDALRGGALAVRASADSVQVAGLAMSHAEGTFAADASASPGARVAAARATSAATPNGTTDDVSGGTTESAIARALLRDGRFTVRAGSDSAASLALAGRTARAADSAVVVLDSARLALAPGRAYALTGPARLVTRSVGGVAVLDSLVLRDATGARLAAAGRLQDVGAVEGTLALDGVPIADLARAAGLAGTAESGTSESYEGRLSLAVQLGGTRDAPLLDLAARADSARLAGVAIERLAAEGHYTAQRLTAQLGLYRDGARLLTASAALPLDLALRAGVTRQLPDTLRGTLRTDSLDLALLGAVVPGVRDVAGRVRAALDLAGTWQRPRLDGALRLGGGAATVVPAGLRLQALAADVALSGDSVVLERVFARSGGPGDTLSLTGVVRLAPSDDPVLALRLAARNFLAVDRPRVATLWLSTPVPVTLSGSYRRATVRGAVRAERGRIYIPELIDKRIVDLNEYRDVVDTAVFANRRLVPAPSLFVERVTLDDVRVEVGDDVWLRSPEANIKLGGSLAVTRAAAERDGLGREAAEAQLALLGSLAVTRGTYRLNLGFAQPIFDVEPGTLRFFGTGDLNPTLDIRAVHTVRQVRQTTNRPDVRVLVNIGGTLAQPTLRLSSADTPPIPDTDLVSYLVTGEPASAVLGQTQGGEQGAALALRLAGSLLSGALTGGPFDIVQVQTGGVGQGEAESFARRASGSSSARASASAGSWGGAPSTRSPRPLRAQRADRSGVALAVRQRAGVQGRAAAHLDAERRAGARAGIGGAGVLARDADADLPADADAGRDRLLPAVVVLTTRGWPD
jgi:translocation and assembly module TamB